MSFGAVNPVAIHRLLAAMHALFTQTCPDAHAIPQPPQFAGSLWVVTHALPHKVQPSWHDATHVPETQVTTPKFGLEQPMLQSPQCPGSSMRSAQAPPQSLA